MVCQQQTDWKTPFALHQTYCGGTFTSQQLTVQVSCFKDSMSWRKRSPVDLIGKVLAASWHGSLHASQATEQDVSDTTVLSRVGCSAELTLQLRKGCLSHGAATWPAKQVHVLRHAGEDKTKCGDLGAVVTEHAPEQTSARPRCYHKRSAK